MILETGELATYDNVRRASWLAMLAGADFIKTSTGKVPPAATPAGDAGDAGGGPRLPEALTGRQVGVKPAGGIRTSKDAIKYLVLVNETAGEDWLRPGLVPAWAPPALLNDLLMQRTEAHDRAATSGPDYFTLD